MSIPLDKIYDRAEEVWENEYSEETDIDEQAFITGFIEGVIYLSRCYEDQQ